MTAGWPCQPFSVAGKRKGTDDERAIWPHVARCIRALRPKFVVLENVATIVRNGELGRVGNSLAEAGYDFRWACVRASEVGAPHQRERCFIVAADIECGGFDGGFGTVAGDTEDPIGLAKLLPTPRSRDGKCGSLKRAGDGYDLPSALLPTPRTSDTNGPGLHGHGGLDLRTAVALAPDTNFDKGEFGKYSEAIRRWERLTRPVPPATEPNTTGGSRLNAAFAEWMMGLPAGWVTDVPALSRNSTLRILGNGVVPQQASAALSLLLGIENQAA